MMEDNSDMTDAVGDLIRRQKEKASTKWRTKALKLIIVILVVLALALLFAKYAMA